MSMSYCYVQEGGTRDELYLAAHETMAAAEAGRKACRDEGSYRTTPIFPLPTEWVTSELSAMLDVMLSSVASLGYPEGDAPEEEGEEDEPEPPPPAPAVCNEVIPFSAFHSPKWKAGFPGYYQLRATCPRCGRLHLLRKNWHGPTPKGGGFCGADIPNQKEDAAHEGQH